MEESPITQPEEQTQETPAIHPARYIVFTVLSFGFLGWALFGQIEARVWVSGQLTLLDRRIASMWGYLGNNLPDLPMASAFGAIYWLSISVILVGTIAGLWLFLGSADDSAEPEIQTVTHAPLPPHETE